MLGEALGSIAIARADSGRMIVVRGVGGLRGGSLSGCTVAFGRRAARDDKRFMAVIASREGSPVSPELPVHTVAR
jgi:hypothetical protein